MTHAAFTDHTSSPLAYDATGLQPVQRRLIESAINTLPRPEHRAFAQHLLNGHTPTSAAALMGQPAVVGARWWLDVQPALKDKLGPQGREYVQWAEYVRNYEVRR